MAGDFDSERKIIEGGFVEDESSVVEQAGAGEPGGGQSSGDGGGSGDGEQGRSLLGRITHFFSDEATKERGERHDAVVRGQEEEIRRTGDRMSEGKTPKTVEEKNRERKSRRSQDKESFGDIMVALLTEDRSFTKERGDELWTQYHNGEVDFGDIVKESNSNVVPTIRAKIGQLNLSERQKTWALRTLATGAGVGAGFLAAKSTESFDYSKARKFAMAGAIATSISVPLSIMQAHIIQGYKGTNRNESLDNAIGTTGEAIERARTKWGEIIAKDKRNLIGYFAGGFAGGLAVETISSGFWDSSDTPTEVGVDEQDGEVSADQGVDGGAEGDSRGLDLQDSGLSIETLANSEFASENITDGKTWYREDGLVLMDWDGDGVVDTEIKSDPDGDGYKIFRYEDNGGIALAEVDPSELPDEDRKLLDKINIERQAQFDAEHIATPKSPVEDFATESDAEVTPEPPVDVEELPDQPWGEVEGAQGNIQTTEGGIQWYESEDGYIYIDTEGDGPNIRLYPDGTAAHYGPDSDTWQPGPPVANEMEMIGEVEADIELVAEHQAAAELVATEEAAQPNPIADIDGDGTADVWEKDGEIYAKVEGKEVEVSYDEESGIIRLGETDYELMDGEWVEVEVEEPEIPVGEVEQVEETGEEEAETESEDDAVTAEEAATGEETTAPAEGEDSAPAETEDASTEPTEDTGADETADTEAGESEGEAEGEAGEQTETAGGVQVDEANGTFTLQPGQSMDTMANQMMENGQAGSYNDAMVQIFEANEDFFTGAANSNMEAGQQISHYMDNPGGYDLLNGTMPDGSNPWSTLMTAMSTVPAGTSFNLP